MPMTPSDQQKYRSLYFTAAKPYVHDLHEAITQLRSGNVEPNRLASAHRSAHSLTSQSTLMGFEKISSVTSLLEHILRAKIDNNLEFHEELLRAMEDASAKVVEAIEKLEVGEGEIEMEAERAALLALSHIEA